MKTLATLLCTGLLAAPALGQMTIERLAPENSVIVVGMPNMQLSRDRFERTPLFDLWMSDEMVEMREVDETGLAEMFNEFVDELGVDRNELSIPTGAMGFAMYPVIDEQTGRPKAAMLGFVDYGAKAGPVGAMVLAALDRGERERMLEFDVKEILGRQVYEITMREEEVPLDDDGFDDDFDEWEEFDMMPDPFEMLGDLETMYYLQDENIFMLCSDLGSLTEALDRIDGNAQAALTDRDDFQAIMGQIGRDDVYAVFLTRDLMQIASAFDEAGMLMFVQPTIKAVFGDIRGIGMGGRIEGRDAMLEARWSVYMPAGKSGIARLFDISAPRGAVPGFVGADTISYSTINIRFDQVVDVVRQIIQSNPFLAMQAEEIMPMMEGPVADILATLGSRVHTAASVTHPIQADSLQYMMALDLQDPVQFEKLIAPFAPEMGMEGRDFLGHRIFTSDMGGMMGPGMESVSLGIGGGHAFVGPTPAVEQALRSVGQEDQVAGLAADPAFARAIEALGQRQIVGFSYTNAVAMMEAAAETARLTEQQWREQFLQDHPEWADEMEFDDDEFDFIDFNLLRRYIGATVAQMRATDDGFVGSIFLLAPEAE